MQAYLSILISLEKALLPTPVSVSTLSGDAPRYRV